MFSQPSNEGTDDNNPVIMTLPEKISPNVFESFMLHLTSSAFDSIVFERDYMDLMVLADFYRCKTLLRAFARRQDIVQDPPYLPMEKLHLGVRFSYPEWKTEALRALLSFPFYQFSDEDIRLLSSIGRTADTPNNHLPNLYSVITHYRSLMASDRLDLVNLNIKIDWDPFTCSPSAHDRCISAWLIHWHLRVIPTLFSRTKPMTEEEFETLLSQEFDLMQMNEDCQAAHLSKVLSRGVLNKAAILQDQAVSEALTYSLTL